MDDLSPDPRPTPPARPYRRRCQDCGQRKDGVRYDRHHRRDLCAACWAARPPAGSIVSIFVPPPHHRPGEMP